MGRILPLQRVLTIEAFPHGGEIYFRTREIAYYLGVKQQFEFTSDLKSALGSHVIKKGDETVEFRTIDDNGRTTFVSAKDLKTFLEMGAMKHKIIQYQRESLLSFLNVYH